MRSSLTLALFICLLPTLAPSESFGQSRKEGLHPVKERLTLEHEARTEDDWEKVAKKYEDARDIFERTGMSEVAKFIANNLGGPCARVTSKSILISEWSKSLGRIPRKRTTKPVNSVSSALI